MKKLNICRGLLLVLTISAGCGKPEGYHYLAANLGERANELVASQEGAFKAVRQSIIMVRRFEHKSSCDAEKESFIKNGMTAECTYQNLAYEPVFLGQPIGKWCAVHYVGPMPPTVIIYESLPPLPDELMLKQLKATVPHVLKWAALHNAPAQVRIFSPAAEVKD